MLSGCLQVDTSSMNTQQQDDVIIIHHTSSMDLILDPYRSVKLTSFFIKP